MKLKTLFILLSIRSTFGDFLPVHGGCKYWTFLKVYGNGEAKKMHCILDQDFQPGLVYTDWKTIPKGTCPIYNRFAREIDTIRCNSTIGVCPKDSIPSYSGVTFTGCYDAIRRQTNVIRLTTNTPPATSDRQTNVIRPTTNAPPATSDSIALIAVATLCVITISMVVVSCCIGYFLYRRNLEKCRETRGTSKWIHDKPRNHSPCFIENVMPREQGQRRVLSTMRGNEYLVTNETPLVADDYERDEITEDKFLTSLESIPDDARVQTAWSSGPSSGMYSQISTADSKAYEDHLADAEYRWEQCRF